MIVPPGFGPAAFFAAFFYALSMGPAKPHDMPCLPVDPTKQIEKAFNEIPFATAKTGEGRLTIYASKNGSSFSVIFKPKNQKLWCAIAIGTELRPVKVPGEDS